MRARPNHSNAYKNIAGKDEHAEKRVGLGSARADKCDTGGKRVGEALSHGSEAHAEGVLGPIAERYDPAAVRPAIV